MSTWFSKLFSGQDAPDPRLNADQQRLLADWSRLPPPDLGRSHRQSRYVVVDVELGGLDTRTESLLAIGALAVTDGLIDFNDAFRATLATDGPPPTEAEAGSDRPSAAMAPADALIALLRFAGKAPLVVYHAVFVAKRLERALSEHLRLDLPQPWLDLAWVMSDLFREVSEMDGRLDPWLDHFAIESIRRHDALSDAYDTARLLQIAIAKAARKGFDTPASLLELEKARRHMHQDG
ncbi:MAG TPA: 3'-5' exonuclease [Accumulibacter sp.]|jgi:DNA polymerase-3 subunit epsilon|nr:3'-5' exonuclease [Accumulibacter sp.]HQC79924.1 3'-5' exonuclease [Accumulibacter sp.]